MASMMSALSVAFLPLVLAYCWIGWMACLGRISFQRLSWFWENLGAFNVLQSQAPQTLAHALADSPTGLLGWNGA